MDFSKFHIVTVVNNPIRYKSRYELYKIFEEDITRKGAQLWTIEMQTGKRYHRVTKPDEPRHIQLWNSALPGELWTKEALQNIAVQHLTARCPDWRYVLFADADIKFENGALNEIAHALQHWDVVQPWSHAIDFGPQGETTNVHQSYMYCHWNGIEVGNKTGYSQGGHPGFAMAFRREALNHLGGLIDFGILGSGDRHMMTGLVGKILQSAHGDCHSNYKKWLVSWQAKAERHIRRNVGFIHATIRHMWHGRKADRGYSTRWGLLVKHQFDPETDIKRDVSGMWQLVSETPRQISLRDDIRRYFRARKEDASTI